MTKRKYTWEKMTQADLLALYEKYPTAVKVEMRPLYSIISKLLDCSVEVPGVRLTPESGKPPGYIQKAVEKLA